MRKESKNIVQNLVILLFTALILFSLLESGLRIFYSLSKNAEKPKLAANSQKDLRPRYIYEENRYTGYKLKSNLKTYFSNIRTTRLFTNSFGLRDREYGKKEQKTFRIVVLGDSFTFGWDVEADLSYPKQLEKILNTRIHDRKFEVINCGIPGYGTDQELEFLKNIVSMYEPDIVLLGFYVGNDIIDNMIGGIKRRSVKDGYLLDNYLHEKSDKDSKLKKFSNFLAEKSLLFSIVRDRYEKLVLKLGYHSNVNPYYQLEIKQLDVFKKNYDTKTERGIKKTEDLIEEINHISSFKDARIAIILIPAFYQIYQKAWGNYLSSYGLNTSFYDPDKPNEKLNDFFKQHKIEALDLLEKFREFGKNENLYLFGHWNARGHSLAAYCIFDFLKQNLLKSAS